ncbi:MAG: alpha/beta fold hydrolase, partial [Candidatus Competibacteraceae bacterium]|nr:alpha/beta fold hydrolase [Candidatus Competibacteraceae bacterium]
SPINRYYRGSLADPERWTPNWNRSFELKVDSPKAGVLMLHGLSDSPYSLRSLAERLHEAGAWVVGLRLPGHGTVPSGLVEVRWQDMAAAVRLAMRYLHQQAGGQPLIIVGYSNGGALAVHYALDTLADAGLPAVSRLVLLSPEIGVSPAAAFAVWQARIGHLLGLEKLAWNAILPEYDPFKYGSFAVNAGDLAYRITSAMQTRLMAMANNNVLERFPPVLAFQSVVDATVSAPALVANLFARLPENGHELVLFDINRMAGMGLMLRNDPSPGIDRLIDHPGLTFAISLLTNANEHTRRVVVRLKHPGSIKLTEHPMELSWPVDVYSLSHVALPFPPDDPLYGGEQAAVSPGIQLGSLALRGERGVLWVGAGDMLRMRWNPFYPYLEQRLLDFIGLSAGY